MLEPTINFRYYFGQSSDKLRLTSRHFISMTKLTSVILTPGIDSTFVGESQSELLAHF